MSAVPAKQIDLTAPPIVTRIGQRALVVGIVFGIGALALAFLRPDEFYRGYLLGYMDWLGVALGSMAIVMIRHLTGGGWGTVIRRVLGAAMRVAYLVSGAMPGVLPNTPLVVERGKLKLKLSGKYRDLAGERVFARLKQLARLIGREPVMVAV